MDNWKTKWKHMPNSRLMRVKCFGMIYYRKIILFICILCEYIHRSHMSILNEVQIKTTDLLLPIIPRRIFKFVGHTVNRNDHEKIIIQGKMTKDLLRSLRSRNHEKRKIFGRSNGKKEAMAET